MQIKTSIITVMLLTVSFPTWASVNSGPYVGVELGTDNQIVNFVPSAFNLNTNGSQLYSPNWGFAGRINFGYNFNKYNGVELAPTYYFSQNYNYPNGSGSTGISATSLDLSYLPTFPIADSKWSVFGRLGIAYDWINSSTSSSCNCGVSSTPSGSNVADVIGAGFRYRISLKSSFRVEWIANGLFFPIGIGNNNGNIANWSTQSFMAGINYHF